MFLYCKRQKKTFLFAATARLIVFVLSFSLIFSPTAGYAQVGTGFNPAPALPVPGTMIQPSPAFVPVLLKGMTIHPDDPLRFDFIIDSGNTDFNSEQIKNESERLVKYFLASMTVPKDDLWVNLSPYENERIIPEELGKTELGRDMLAQDYILKQLTASLMYPEKELGKKFWDTVYKKAEEQFGTSEIPVDTFNKVWILPESATVYEHEQTVYVVDAKLKVMLEEDYIAMEHNLVGAAPRGRPNINGQAQGPAPTNGNHPIAADIVRAIILPAIEREVNEGENFANLRQIYHSLILSKWYKETVKNSLLSRVYVDQNKIAGVDVDDKTIKDQIYAQYMEAYKKGVFNFIKEDYDRLSREVIPRKYFSGGEELTHIPLDRSNDPIRETKTPKYFLKIKIDPAPVVSSPVRRVTEAERKGLLEVAQEEFGDLQSTDIGYLDQMWRQALERFFPGGGLGAKPPLRIVADRDKPGKGENFILAYALNSEERRALGELKYEDLKTEENMDAAKDVVVTLNVLDAGIGEKVDRLDYKKELMRRELESRGKVIEGDEVVTAADGGKLGYKIYVRGEGIVDVRRGAKGTDLGYKVAFKTGGEVKTVFVSIAEAKILRLIEIAKKDSWKGLRFQPIVNWQSKMSYEELMNKPYLYDHRKTYREILEEAGVVLLEMETQADLPWIEKETGRITLMPDNNETGFRYRQPGGHGQLGYRFLWNTYADRLPDGGDVHIRVFYNGDNMNSRVDEYIAGAMSRRFMPVIKLTTKATPIDKKGGKDGVRVAEIGGRNVHVPDQMELADAQAQGQEKEFIAAGQNAGEHQPFNTNIIYINTSLLQRILKKLVRKFEENGIDGEEKLKELISPTYIKKGVKKGEDGNEYIPIDGAIATAMHNLNAFFLTDPMGRDVLAEVKREVEQERGITIHEGFDRILYFVDIPRTDFFTPVKNNFDLTLQGASDYYQFTPNPEEPAGWFFRDTDPGSVPPQVALRPEKGFWDEQQNHLEAFGDLLGELGVRGLKSLEIHGKVLLKGASLSGDILIINRSDSVVDLNSERYKNENPDLFNTDGRLVLRDIRLVIEKDENLVVLTEPGVSSPVNQGIGDRVQGLGRTGHGSQATRDDELGGIDLNEINVDRRGAGVNIRFDPVKVQEIIDMGIDGFVPVIINLTPLPSVLPLLGLEPKREEEPEPSQAS